MDRIAERQAHYRATQDAIMKALRKAPMTTPEDMERSIALDRAMQDQTAEKLGVDPEEYRRWCSGVPNARIRKAMLKAK